MDPVLVLTMDNRFHLFVLVAALSGSFAAALVFYALWQAFAFLIERIC